MVSSAAVALVEFARAPEGCAVLSPREGSTGCGIARTKQTRPTEAKAPTTATMPMCSNFRLDGRAVDISLPGLLSAVTEGAFRPCPGSTGIWSTYVRAVIFAVYLTRGIGGIARRIT